MHRLGPGPSGSWREKVRSTDKSRESGAVEAHTLPRWAAHPAPAALLLVSFFLCLRRELFVVLDT